MKKQIRVREYRDRDSGALENIIREAWKYDKLTGPATASKLAKVFLYSCLCSQTYAQVALADEMPVGVIMGKNLNKHKCPLKYRVKQITSILSLFLSREGRKIIKIFGCINGIDKNLLKSSGKSYQGEIAFFAVDSEFRGRGVGKMLFQNIKTYMKNEDIQCYYLFTDTSCNFGFYEHQGMNRCREHTQSFTVRSRPAEMKFFLFDQDDRKMA